MAKIDRKASTVELQSGVQYAKVATRSAEFHSDNEQCSIETTVNFNGDDVLFTAKVTSKKGVFTGHSHGRLSGREKQFEKLETIAVGRALAFAGYLASGEIACAEEMADVVSIQMLTALKKKYMERFKGELEELSRLEKLAEFCEHCGNVVGLEEVDYNDASMWKRAWYDSVLEDLSGTGSEVQFE